VREFGLPLVIKPRRSYWIDGLDRWGAAHVIDSLEELAHVLGHTTDHARCLVEGYFAGQGGGISVLADDGTILQAFQHRRLREGKGRSSSYRMSLPLHPAMLADCAKICAHTRLTGVAMFEFRDNPETGAWVLIEINARFWGSMALPLSLGLDFPNLLYDLLVRGMRQPARPYPAGIRSRNLMLDAYYLATELKTNGKRRWLRDAADFALQPVRWATGREFSDGFSIDDLRPGFQEMATALSGRLSRFRGPKLTVRGDL
jgi:predicted ATP-grasp superfamily ATP-dependent carboligase